MPHSTNRVTIPGGGEPPDRKTTIRLPGPIHMRLRIAAAMADQSINEYIVSLLDEVLPEVPAHK